MFTIRRQRVELVGYPYRARGRLSFVFPETESSLPVSLFVGAEFMTVMFVVVAINVLWLVMSVRGSTWMCWAPKIYIRAMSLACSVGEHTRQLHPVQGPLRQAQAAGEGRNGDHLSGSTTGTSYAGRAIRNYTRPPSRRLMIDQEERRRDGASGTGVKWSL